MGFYVSNEILFIKSCNSLVFDDASGFMNCCFVLGDEAEIKR